ncbi:unnamed protein product [Miscanthus lutarioriparius]|uniref:DNA-directed RNA polymerase subunit n=1 Tax=Miscanthus lutarioriparius TaxID=422564 RepID=A0A811P3S6_9POAL|nr:unnamed protein product [Miscanthus lutarioriparius]
MDMSRNQLSGAIPAELGAMPVLSVLDLSSNELSGAIPPELVKPNLNALNLSSNHLSGQVPIGFATGAYDNSFRDNPGLCTEAPVPAGVRSCAAAGSQDRGSSRGVSHALRTGLLVAGGALLAAAAFALLLVRDIKKRPRVAVRDEWKITPFVQDLGFGEASILRELTEENLIGRGGSGHVYRVTYTNQRAYTNKVNEKVDVYSFGVVLLELTTGKEASAGGEHGCLAEWARHHYQSGGSIPDATDKSIRYAGYSEEIQVVFRLGVLCTTDMPSSRPIMKDVLQILLNCSEQTRQKSKMENGQEVERPDTTSMIQGKYPALRFKQQLTAYVEKIYGIIGYSLKNAEDGNLGLLRLELDPIQIREFSTGTEVDAELQKGPVHGGDRCPRRGQWRAQSMEGMGQPAEAKHVSSAAAMTARAGGAGAARVRGTKKHPNHRKRALKRIYHACKTNKVCGEGDDLDVQQQQDTDEHVKIRGGCGAQQPIITVDGMKMLVEFKAPKKKNDDREQLSESVEPNQILSAERVLNILKRISDGECLLLGLHPKLARPDWMILQVLPIPPPPVRPSVMMGTSSKSEDDLIHQLAMIIRHNENLRRQERNGAPAHIIEEFAQLLQFHIATYFDNELPGQPRATQRSGRPIKSICSRLKAKEGRVRENLMGKRVDISARTVITPDPNINIDELGVPWSIALNLTYPETVTPYNIERLKELVLNGPHPPSGKTGAKYIIREDGQRLDLRYVKKSNDQHLELGYKVERHLNDGDFVHFNREEVGPDAARKFLGYTQGLVNYWLLQNGFSIGIGDMIADADTMKSINRAISSAKDSVMKLIKQARDKKLEAELGRTMMESFENKVNEVLNTAGNMAGSSAQKRLSDSNNLKAMGLTTQEFFFHAMGGREGLIDTAVKTSETGYIQRRLVKAMEDITVKYDGTNCVRGEVHNLEADRFQLGTEIATNGNHTWPLPVNLKWLIWNAQKTFKIDIRTCSDMHPIEIVEAIDKLQERPKVVSGDDAISIEVQKNATLFFNIYLHATFASKRVLKEYMLTREAFEWIIDEIVWRFSQSLVAPSEMIGCVAAQSIGEPTTQMTLNTFHFAGVSAKNVTLGVPRLREIINVAKKIKTPSSLGVHHTRSVTHATEVWYDPDPMGTIIEEDLEFVRSCYEMLDEDIDLDKISPWLLRIELNREMMVDKKLSTVFIKEVKVNKLDVNDGFKEHKEWMLDTEGVNLLAIMCHEDVDATRTTSNHLTEVIEVLGIEVVHRALFDELWAVISFDGSYVNYRHLAVLCDTMTYRGHLMAITRHGINRNDTRPLMRCSFEETMDILFDAAIHAESDYLRGVTENIMLG